MVKHLKLRVPYIYQIILIYTIYYFSLCMCEFLKKDAKTFKTLEALFPFYNITNTPARLLSQGRLKYSVGRHKMQFFTNNYSLGLFVMKQLFFKEANLIMQSILCFKHELLTINTHLIRSFGVDSINIELFHNAATTLECLLSIHRFCTSSCQIFCLSRAVFSQLIVCSLVFVASIISI